MMDARDIQIKRLKMRSMRRGIKEMDIILSRYAARRLQDLSAADLDRYEAVLSENDQDLYRWVSGQAPAPEALQAVIADIADAALAVK